MKSQNPEDKENILNAAKEKTGHIQKIWCHNYFGLHRSDTRCQTEMDQCL